MITFYTSVSIPRESHCLIHHAASKGVKEAHHVLNNVCTLGHCV